MDTTKLAVDLFDKRADDYQEKYMDQGLYHHSFDLFCDYLLTQNAAVLDIACGPGNVAQYLLQKRPDFNILGIDLAPNMVRLAQANNPGAAFQVMDIRAVRQLDQRYDGILCCFGLPYLSKEAAIALIGDVAALLKPNGIFYLSTMEDDYEKSGIQYSSKGEPLYMFFHQADYLTEALAQNGFTVLDLIRQDFPTTDGKKTTDLLMIAKR